MVVFRLLRFDIALHIGIGGGVHARETCAGGGHACATGQAESYFWRSLVVESKSELILQCLLWPRGTRFPVPMRISGATLLNLTVRLPAMGPFALVASPLSYVVPPMVNVCPPGN